MKKLLLVLALFSFTAHGLVLGMQKFLDDQSMGASFNGSAIDVSETELVSIQAVWTGGGAPVGTLAIQVSNDDLSPTNWSDYPSGSIAISGDGDAVFNIASLGFKWIRMIYTRTSGTGTLDAMFVKKVERNIVQ